MGYYWSNGISVCIEIHPSPQKIKWIPHVPPFKVTKGYWTDTDQSDNYDLPLVIHSNHGPILYKLYYFQDTVRYWPKIVNFSYPHVFNVPIEGCSLGIL